MKQLNTKESKYVNGGVWTSIARLGAAAAVSRWGAKTIKADRKKRGKGNPK